jgi:hypothetical protein
LQFFIIKKVALHSGDHVLARHKPPFSATCAINFEPTVMGPDVRSVVCAMENDI